MAYRDSTTAGVVLRLQGVWVHDPDQGGQTSRQYRYGAAQRDDSLRVESESNFYAGRADAVVDFGEHEVHAFGVTVDLPHGPTWLQDVETLRAWARSRRVLHVRDNRGRAVFGTLEDLRLRDVAWGTQASFTVTSVGRVLPVVAA